MGNDLKNKKSLLSTWNKTR